MNKTDDFNFKIKNITKIFAIQWSDLYPTLDYLHQYLELMFDDYMPRADIEDMFERYEYEYSFDQRELGSILFDHKETVYISIEPVVRKGYYDGINFDYEVYIGLYSDTDSISYVSANYKTFFAEDTIDSLLKKFDIPPSYLEVKDLLEFINETINQASATYEHVLMWSGANVFKKSTYSQETNTMYYKLDRTFQPPEINSKMKRI